jgi:LysM repeat protein
MKKIFLLVGLIFVASVFQGCGTPELERTPYGQDEVRWEGFIQNNYRGWQAPQSVPPSSMDEPLSSADVPALPPLPDIVVDDTVNVPPVLSSTAETYTISKGDTLWSISKKFYGKGGNWQLILDANTAKIGDPNKLKAGTVINIPPKP